jgi:hypothetical protein
VIAESVVAKLVVGEISSWNHLVPCRSGGAVGPGSNWLPHNDGRVSI